MTHEVHAEVVYREIESHIESDGTKVIDEMEVIGVTYRCEEGDLNTSDLTEVASHVVVNQFRVR